MGDAAEEAGDQGAVLLALYDRALPQVYGYLQARTHDTAVAEDLTAETFLAAVDAVQRRAVDPLTIAWLVGVARHKLADHWRRLALEDRKLALVHDDETTADDAWDVRLDVVAARATLDRLGPHHRSALTLRYLDGLPVPEVAEHLGRTLHATEALLVRARSAFRRTYEGTSDAC